MFSTKKKKKYISTTIEIGGIPQRVRVHSNGLHEVMFNDAYCIKLGYKSRVDYLHKNPENRGIMLENIGFIPDWIPILSDGSIDILKFID